MPDDLLLRGALVIDGTGAPGVRGDVSIAGGRIRSVGTSGQGSANRVVDAEGLVVSPGFIDLHTHSDFTLPSYPRAASMVTQGVTTQLTGNCGFSPFPVSPVRGELLKEYVGFLDAGLPWGAWQSAAEYLDLLQGLPLASNVACQIGHGSVRIATMGFDTAPPTPAQLAQMQGEIADALEAGVFGMSSGLTYAPASASDTDELVALAMVLAGANGFYSTHIRNEATTVVEAMQEALEIGRRAGVPVQVSHHKIMGQDNWAKIATTLSLVDAAAETGQDVTMDQYPYTAGSTGLAVVLPRWALEGGVSRMRSRLEDPVERARIREQMDAQRPEDLAAGLRAFEPDRVVFAETPPGPLTAYVGKTLAEVAIERSQPAVDVALDLLREAGGEILTIVHGQSEDNLRRIMRHPRTAIASDGWTLSPDAGGRPHPRSYGTFARVLGRYARDEQVLSLPEAVRKMTSLPARRLGLGDRGVIRPGAAADLVVFDPQQVRDNATFESPHRFSSGIQMVVVNGAVVIEDGVDTGAVAGQVLRRPQRGSA